MKSVLNPYFALRFDSTIMKKTDRQPFSPKAWSFLAGAVAFLLYLNSCTFEYTMDDDIFFLKHRSVQKGLSGSAEIFSRGSMEMFDGTKGVQTYRPAYLMVFALEKQLFGEVPAISHFINVVLYALLAIVLLGLLLSLLRNHDPLLSGLITLLFVVHPVHTEVVASVKSRDEILAALFCLLAWRSYLVYLDKGERRRQLAAVAWFLLASFTKESTIAFLAVYPFSAVVFRSRSIKSSLKDTVPFLAVSVCYLAVRIGIEGTVNEFAGLPILANVLTAAKDVFELYATKLEILWYNLKMVFLPWPLAWDYSYNQIPLVGFGSILPWLALVSYAAMLYAGIRYLKTQPVLAFGCWFFLFTSSPTNNFFVNNTTTFGERLLFTPSLGACIIVVTIVFAWGRNSKKASISQSALIPVLTLASLFTILTIVRAADWKDNLRLFETGVEVNPASSRTQYSLASELFKQAQRLPEGEKRNDYLKRAGESFRKSIQILPENFQARYNYALYSSYTGDTSVAISEYKRILELKSDYLEAINNLGVIYNSKRDFANAYRYYKMAYDLDPDALLAKSNLGAMLFNQGLDYGMRGQQDSAIGSYRMALRYDSSMVMAYNNIASIFAGRGTYDSCLHYLKKAYAFDNSNLMVIENIAAVSYLNREYDQGIDFANRALQMNPRATKSINTLVNCYTALGKPEEAAKCRAKLN
jgi:tetratricopeptide (TPR) repeat protein